MSAPQTWIGLLRGINVGGRHKLPMAELRAMVEASGGSAVRTYIQSGNLLFDAAPNEVAEVVVRSERAILQAKGFEVPIVLRSADELAAARGASPFADEALETPKFVYIGFLPEEPEPAQVATLDPSRSPPDRFKVIGREIHLHFPNGSARSKLTNAWFDRALGQRSTWRNFRTVDKLVALASP